MIELVVGSEIGGSGKYGLDRLAQALKNRGIEARRSDGRKVGDASHTVRVSVEAGTPESFAVEVQAEKEPYLISVVGGDPTGLMYALLAVAEQIERDDGGNESEILKSVRSEHGKPYLAERGMSIYTMHRGVWEAFLFDPDALSRTFGMMAESRLDSFVVIFGYENGGFMAPPYPYFFDLPEFPGVRCVGLSAADRARNTACFRDMIAAAHDHGIRVSVGIWDHIYRGGVQSGGVPGADDPSQERRGIVTGLDADNLSDYSGAAIARFLERFPALDGLQLRMHNESGLAPEEMAAFWHDVFSNIARARPDLSIDLRAKELPDAIIDDARQQGLSIRVTTKYWMEQLGMPFHPTHTNVQNQRDRRHSYADLLAHSRGYRVHWRLWNAVTNGPLLWANPDWIRRFVQSATLQGRSFEFNRPNATWMLGRPSEEPPLPVHSPDYRWYTDELERHRHTLMLFGRLGYDPQCDPAGWNDEFRRRFADAGPHLMEALHLAGLVIPRIVAAAYCYSLFPTTIGSASRDSQGPLWEFALAEGSDIAQFAAFREEADLLLSQGETARRRPLQTAEWFDEIATQIDTVLGEVGRPDGRGMTAEATCIATDAAIISRLARFYAERIPAAVSYNLFAKTGDLYALDDAVGFERSAVSQWRALVAAAGDVYERELPIGARRPSLQGHWSDELKRLESRLAELEAWAQDQEDTPVNYAEIAHVPVGRLAQGEPLDIRATVSWPFSSPVVTVTVTSAAGESVRRRLTPEHGRRYRVTIPVEDLPADSSKELSYYLDVQSPGRHRIATPGGMECPYRVHITDDRRPPSVVHEHVGAAVSGKSVTVRAQITDESGLAWARLRYRHLSQYEDYNVAEMQVADGYFTAEIPPEFVSGEWDLVYYIEAMDRAGNGVIYPDLDRETPYIVVPVVDDV